eukprot:COSAG01_NODE_166_length_23296_cov_140.506014_18_plen_34_part_00
MVHPSGRAARAGIIRFSVFSAVKLQVSLRTEML